MSQHGDADVCIGGFAPDGGEACGFGSHDDGGGSTQVDIVVEA